MSDQRDVSEEKGGVYNGSLRVSNTKTKKDSSELPIQRTVVECVTVVQHGGEDGGQTG